MVLTNKLFEFNMLYNKKFFKNLQEGSLRSAQQVVPIVIEFLNIKSVVDFGCGTGAWLKTFKDFGVHTIVGYDGRWVKREDLLIDSTSFFEVNFDNFMPTSEKFDLVVSLEVGEHLHEKTADAFVELLTKSSDYVLFSAAIPFQGGTGHINEQWPEYWCEKFMKQGYEPIDCIRPIIWDNRDVSYWFKQNILLFVNKNVELAHPKLKEYKQYTNPRFLSKVHPDFYTKMASKFARLKKIIKFRFFG